MVKRHTLQYSVFSFCLIFSAFSVSVNKSFAIQQSLEPSDSNQNANAVETTPDTVSVEDVADDEKIVKRLTSIYRSTGKFKNISVSSNSGFVTLEGETNSDSQYDWAEEVASRTTDVIGVNNRIEVRSVVNIRESISVVWNSLDKLYRDFLMRIPFLIAGAVVILLTWCASRILSWLFSQFLLDSNKVRQSLKDLFRQLASITVWIVGVLLATVVVFPGMTPAKALTVLGLGSVAIGFAFKDIFENFFAGVLILWRYPFDKGDFIRLDDVVGEVREITIRNTLILRMNGELVVVPNGMLFKSNVEVLTNTSSRRERIICGVAYDADIRESREVIQKAVSSCKTVSGDREIQVFAHEFADSSINFEVTWWTDARPAELRRSRDEVITAIKSGLDHAGIEIPFPQRTLTYAE